MTAPCRSDDVVELLDTQERLVAQLAQARAQNECLLDGLAALVRYVKRVGGWMEHADQQLLRAAEAVLVDNGRSTEQ